jgi:CHAD domain-containing protein
VQLKARIDPANTDTIHRTRIAFKRFRYMVEALATLLPGVTDRRLAAMHHYQTMMGDIQDIEVLLATLGNFLRRKEVKAESASHFRDELLRRRQWLIQRYMNTAAKLRDFGPLPVPEIKPARPKKRGGLQ